MEKDFDELVKTIGNLANMQNSDLLKTATANMGSSVLKDIEMCFENEKSPDATNGSKEKMRKIKISYFLKVATLLTRGKLNQTKKAFLYLTTVVNQMALAMVCHINLVQKITYLKEHFYQLKVIK